LREELEKNETAGIDELLPDEETAPEKTGNDE
jgi:hypothetical protein